jgi:hypothetical protein
LDPLQGQKRRFEDDAEEIPDLPDLPEASPKQRTRAIDKARVCDKCKGTEVRIVSKATGVRAFCVCGHNWGIAMASLNPALPIAGARGISKETLVEPDWNLAVENLEEEDMFRRSDEGDD